MGTMDLKWVRFTGIGHMFTVYIFQASVQVACPNMGAFLYLVKGLERNNTSA